MVGYSELKRLLSEKGIESAGFEAKVILEFTRNEKEIMEIAEKRASGYPLQYIIGEWDFYDVTLKVGEGVLIPRQDTETLVDEALRLLKNVEAPRLLDLCSGSGAVVIAVKNNKKGEYFALEKDEKAFGFLRENALKYGGIDLYLKDLEDADAPRLFSELDMITANPPYLTYEDMQNLQTEVGFEPSVALFGGEDGLHFYRYISEHYRSCLKDGGHLLFEVGEKEAEDVIKIMQNCGYKDVYSVRDLCGKERVCVGRK